MATAKQTSGEFGERLVAKVCRCPSCKGKGKLVRLPTNFKCVDVICDFCGYLAQVKTVSVTNTSKIPKRVKGAAWGPQEKRMNAGIYFPLFLVLTTKNQSESTIYYLSADLQTEGMFKPRRPLTDTAQRAGWQGFDYDLEPVRSHVVRVFAKPSRSSRLVTQ